MLKPNRTAETKNKVGNLFHYAFESSLLSLRRPKYLGSLSVTKSSGLWPERIKQLKVLRKIEVDESVKRQITRRTFLHRHCKTLKLVEDPFIHISPKAAVYSRIASYFNFHTLCVKSCRSLLTKLSIKVLHLNATLKSGNEHKPDRFERNSRRIRRQIAHLKDLEIISLTVHDMNHPRSIRYLRLLDDLAPFIPPKVKISLSFTGSREEDEYIISYDQKKFSNLAKRINSITGSCTHFAATYFTKQILDFTRLQKLAITLETDENTNFRYMQSFSALHNLVSLEIDLYCENGQYDAITNFHKHFSVPSKLKILSLGLASQSFQGDLRNLQYPPDRETLLCSFIDRIKKLPDLQAFKFEICINLEDRYVKAFYSIVNSFLPQKPKLRSIQFKILDEKGALPKRIEWLNMQGFISALHTSTNSLEKYNISAPGFTFGQGFDSSQKFHIDKLSLSGKIKDVGGLNAFLKSIEPVQFQGSYLELDIWGLSMDDIDDLFQGISINLKMEGVYLRLGISTHQDDIVVEKIFGLVKKMKGPKYVGLYFPSTSLMKDYRNPILQALNKSIGKIENFVFEFGTDDADRYEYQRNGRYYMMLGDQCEEDV